MFELLVDSFTLLNDLAGFFPGLGFLLTPLFIKFLGFWLFANSSLGPGKVNFGVGVCGVSGFSSQAFV